MHKHSLFANHEPASAYCNAFNAPLPVLPLDMPVRAAAQHHGGRRVGKRKNLVLGESRNAAIETRASGVIGRVSLFPLVAF